MLFVNNLICVSFKDPFAEPNGGYAPSSHDTFSDDKARYEAIALSAVQCQNYSVHQCLPFPVYLLCQILTYLEIRDTLF